MSGGALTIVLVAALVGCSMTDSPQPDPTPTPSSDTPSELATYPSSGGGMDALAVGKLALANGCLVIEGSDESMLVPVFPSDEATWNDGVLTWGGKEYRVGDTIRLGGGGSPPGYVEVPDGCTGLPTWLVAPGQ
ncbi:hypothetical protein AVP42_00900 [Agromyces sp. NDB4Y10]|nr:hypothetical protein AVP42_00900 [Agromyces sp. NDB4Y10]